MIINLNSGAFINLLHVLKADDILINISADLNPSVEAVYRRRDTMLTTAELAVNAEHILLILSNVSVNCARTKELGI